MDVGGRQLLETSTLVGEEHNMQSIRYLWVGAVLAVVLILVLVVYGNWDGVSEEDIEDGGAIGTPQGVALLDGVGWFKDANAGLGEVVDGVFGRALAVRRAADRAQAVWEAAGRNPADGVADPESIRFVVEKAYLAETAAVEAMARVMAVNVMVEWAWELPPSREVRDRAEAAGPNSGAAASVREAWDVAYAALPRMLPVFDEAEGAVGEAEAVVGEAEAAFAGIFQTLPED